jgi:RimJ/RimL family protein N-acetyltransferase
MTLRPLSIDDLPMVASWLSDPRNLRWIDFGPGQPALSAITLRVMMQKPHFCLRVYTSDEQEQPVGIVALSMADSHLRTAMLWYVLGDRSCAGRGLTRRAVGYMLRLAFDELHLRSVHAWVAEGNAASLRILERSGFRPAGRLRAAHELDGQPCDRLLYDVAAGEHKRGET